ncbi:hypothetical protein JW964_09190 [candidate division KSB1 bacterium]|nr:hypothetical protein [candidate division KSB1 bacterium]
MNATKFRSSKLKMMLCIFLIFSLSIPQANYAFVLPALKILGSFFGGKFFEEVFDRSALGQVFDKTMEHLFGERRELRQLPDYYPKAEKEEQIRLTNDAIKIIEEMRRHLNDRRLSDTELIAKLQTMNQQQIMPLVKRLDAIEQRVHKLEAQVTDHEYRVSDLEVELRVQQRRLEASEIYTDDLAGEISRIDSLARLERK